MNSKSMNLIFIIKGGFVLLGYKTRGLGAKLWNGFGGKVKNGETLLEGAARELKEECNLVAELNQIGCITYNHLNENKSYIVHIFYATSYSGQIIESEEMSPIRWFDMTNMPYDSMWPDVPYWFSLVRKKVYFIARIDRDMLECVDKSLSVFNNYEELVNGINK